MREVLGSDVNRLTALFLEVCERHRRHRDYTRPSSRRCCGRSSPAFPVYRTYVRAELGQVSPDGRPRTSRRRSRRRKAAAADLDRRPTRTSCATSCCSAYAGTVEAELVMRFQQLTGPVMAKGVEDTAFYCFHRLVVLNEVGGDPAAFGVSVEAFHRACVETQAAVAPRPCSPRRRTTPSGARTCGRARACCRRSRSAGARPSGAGRRATRAPAGRRLPDRNAEYLLYQTLVGAWPISVRARRRLHGEGRPRGQGHTSWTDPRPAYEDGLAGFRGGRLPGPERSAATWKRSWRRSLLPGGWCRWRSSSSSSPRPASPISIRAPSCGPDSLVDPDNRRPVDYALRRRLLAELDRLSAAGCGTGWTRASPKCG